MTEDHSGRPEEPSNAPRIDEDSELQEPQSQSAETLMSEAERHRLREQLVAAEGRIVAADARARESKQKLREAQLAHAETRDKLRENLAGVREKLKDTSALWSNASKYYSLFFQGILSDEIEKSDVDLGADTYLCLLPSSVPAAMNLRRKYGGRIICDCVENVEVERQSLAPKLRPTTLDMINLSAYGALSSVDGLMTVSNAVERTLRRFGPPVRVQPNYRRFETPAPAGTLRSRFGIPSKARVAIATGGIVAGFEAIIEAISLLPDDVHLIAFVKISPNEYAERIDRLVDELGVRQRVHLSPFVPYDELSPLLADADVGIVALDPGNPNHSVSLPNRIFDFTTAALPFVSPDVIEIAEYVQEYGCGIILEDTEPQSWASAIQQILDDRVAYHEAIVHARSRVNWEQLDDDLIAFLGNPRSVTLLGFRDLSRYQRFLRITDTLTRRGVQVKAAFFSNEPQAMGPEGENFYYFSERYGRGPGLLPVPREPEGL